MWDTRRVGPGRQGLHPLWRGHHGGETRKSFAVPSCGSERTRRPGTCGPPVISSSRLAWAGHLPDMKGCSAVIDERRLDWEGCVNVRDLGGLPTVSGHSTSFGAVVRSDNPAFLTAKGWDCLHA